MRKIKVLIIEDSFFMRKAITNILTTDEIEVIDAAKDGKEGYEKALKLKPDVVTMDIEMPVMNGLDSLKAIMDSYPIPVIMVSTLTKEGADSTLEAFSLGAVDFITKKPAFKEMDSLKDEMISKIMAVGRNTTLKNIMTRQRLLKTSGAAAKSKPVRSERISDSKPVSERIKKNITPCIIGIGISTGGPKALQSVIPNIPKDLPVPIAIVQHMPPFFTKSLADRLDNLSEIGVFEAIHGQIMKPGNAYIAPGGMHMTVDKNLKISISEQPDDTLYRPCVNTTFDSIISHVGKNLLGIIMTGMGQDGLESLKKLHQLGGVVLAQSEQTCIIDGMPGAVIKAGITDDIVDLEKISNSIASFFS